MIQRPRGTRDFGPDEMEARRHYEGVLRRVARTFGFKEVATPIFENTELFTLKSGPNIVEEIYAFEDKGGREIALRPELTAPVIRFFVNELSNSPRPLKLFYTGQCFRYERPQSGRYREFFQFGAELIGNANPETDAEIVALAATMIKALGLREYAIRVGDIGILRHRLSEAGVGKGEMPSILQKLDKKMYDEARPLMEAANMDEGAIEQVFAITRIAGDVSVLDSLDGEASEHLKEVFRVLDAYGIDNVKVDLGVVRGLDYYTGMVFEADAPSLGAEKQICGGGSYSLSELFGGEKVFSTGFAIGFDRILLALQNEGTSPERQLLGAFVVPVSDSTRSKAFETVSMLRKAGIPGDVDLMRRSMSKNMKYASTIGARFVIIIGEKELSTGAVTVRDMETGAQELVDMHLLGERLKELTV
jgi:histidyl-tRNA synthetase